MNPNTNQPASLRYGAPGGDDSQRSRDEIRLIKDMTQEEVELFLRANQIDTAAARELRNEPPHVALAVLDRGPLRACVNPSGALVARIRDAKRGILTGGAGSRYGGMPPPATLDPNASALDKFLSENRIDQAGVASLRSETKEVQQAVMAKGPLVNTTNPSASLMARIRNVKADAQLGLGLGGGHLATASAPPPQPLTLGSVLALENGGGPSGGDINSEALKAIAKLNSSTQPAAGGAAGPLAGGQPAMPGKVMPTPLPGVGVGPTPGPELNSAIEDGEDKRLQDEALKAIQQINNTSGMHQDL